MQFTRISGTRTKTVGMTLDRGLEPQEDVGRGLVQLPFGLLGPGPSRLKLPFQPADLRGVPLLGLPQLRVPLVRQYREGEEAGRSDQRPDPGIRPTGDEAEYRPRNGEQPPRPGEHRPGR